MQEEKSNNSAKEFFNLKEVFGYFFRNKSKNEKPKDINLKMMHAINKIAIVVFLISLIIWLFR